MIESNGVPVARRIATEFVRHAAVRTVVTSGSLGTGASDALSDIDIYVYADDELPVRFREAIAGNAYDEGKGCSELVVMALTVLL